MPAKFLKKITPKTISENCATPYDLLQLPRPNGFVEDKHLYDLFGVINGQRQGQGTNGGTWVQFRGRFQAITPEGEVFDGGAAHIPVLENVISVALDEAKVAANGGAVALEIACRISIKRAPAGKPSATGYIFAVESLIEKEVKADDPIQRMRNQAAQLALPAPVKEEATATPPANDTAKEARDAKDAKKK